MRSTSDRPRRWLRVEVEFPPGLPPEEVAWSLLEPVAGRGLVLEDDPPRAVLYLPGNGAAAWDAVRERASRSGLLPPGWPTGFTCMQPVDDQDWAEIWKAGFQVLRAGRVVIVPQWMEHEGGPGDRVIRLEPGMAFGTGTHATTFGCLTLIERLFTHGDLQAGCRILDAGTGSGILALAALALGAAEAWGVDMDGVALDNAAGNALINGMQERLHLVEGPFPEAVSDVPPVDLVVANLDPVQLVRLAPGLRARTLPGGLMIASGFPVDAAGGVVDALSAAGSRFHDRVDGDGWSAVLMRAE